MLRKPRQQALITSNRIKRCLGSNRCFLDKLPRFARAAAHASQTFESFSRIYIIRSDGSSLERFRRIFEPKQLESLKNPKELPRNFEESNKIRSKHSIGFTMTSPVQPKPSPLNRKPFKSTLRYHIAQTEAIFSSRRLNGGKTMENRARQQKHKNRATRARVNEILRN